VAAEGVEASRGFRFVAIFTDLTGQYSSCGKMFGT